MLGLSDITGVLLATLESVTAVDERNPRTTCCSILMTDDLILSEILIGKLPLSLQALFALCSELSMECSQHQPFLDLDRLARI